MKESRLNENLKKCLSKEKIPLEMILNALKLFKFIFEKRKYVWFWTFFLLLIFNFLKTKKLDDFYTKDELKEFQNVLKKLKFLAENDFIKNHAIQLIDLIEEEII